VIGVYGGHVRDRRRPKGTKSNPPSELGFVAMGVPVGSMTLTELCDAIPPAYSRFVAEAWLRSVENAAAEAVGRPRTAADLRKNRERIAESRSLAAFAI
jgi:hypothetical protein